MINLILAIISSASIASIITALLNKRINKAKATGQELLNVETLTDICNKTFKELADARKEISKLSGEVKQLTEANVRLDCELQRLRRELKKHGYVDGNQGEKADTTV